MKKKTGTLIILGAVLVVCIGAYIGVSAYSKAQEEKAAEAAAPVQLWPEEYGAPVGITYTAEDKTLSFALEDGTWLASDNRDFPLEQSALTSLASILTNLTAVRTIDDAGPLTTYGLEPPAYTVTASDESGNVFTLLIGAENGGNYYAMVKDGARLHTISSTLAGSLKPELLSLIELDAIHSVSETNIDRLTVSGGAKTLTLDKHQDTDDTAAWFIVDGDTSIPEDEFVLAEDAETTASTLIGSAVSGISDLEFSSCAAYKPTDDELKSYGLGAPALSLTVHYTDVTGEDTPEQASTEGAVTVEIGAALPDGGGYYARLPGSDQVCVLSESAVTPLIAALDAMGVSAG